MGNSIVTNTTLLYLKFVFLWRDFVTKILLKISKTWFKKAGFTHKRNRYPAFLLRSLSKWKGGALNIIMGGCKPSLPSPIPSLKKKSSHLRSLFAVFRYICFKAEMAFLRGKLAFLRWWVKGWRIVSGLYLTLGLSSLPHAFLLYHKLDSTVRIAQDFTFIPSFKCINIYLVLRSMESFIHLNIERSVNRPFPSAEYFLESVIYALTQFFFPNFSH